MTIPVCTPTTLTTPWLGRAGNMQPLPGADNSTGVAMSRSAVVHQLANGGNAVTRQRRVRRTYDLTWSQLTPDVADMLVAFYSGAFAPGPYRLVDPAWRNLLSLDSSNMGLAYGANDRWAATVGDTVALDLTVAPPAGAARSGVLRWTAPGAAHTLVEGSVTAGPLYTANQLEAAPYVPALPYTFSCYVRTASGTVAGSIYLLGIPAGGSWVSSVVTQTASFTTAWQRISVSIAANTWTAAQASWVMPAVQVTAASSGDILVAGAQMEAGVTVPRPWVTGLGCPRVSINDPMDASGTVNWRRSHSMELVEA